MSTINTNGINVNYPVPGVNNSTQGFRDNFANIKTNLDTASSEITDLQQKVVLKQALANSTLNNDMAGTLISNATTRGFRASTYNLGNALSGTVVVDVSLGDVQYGTVTGNVTLQFGGWGPVNTESSVVLKLAVSNANAVINFPSEVITTSDGFGTTVLENYSNNGTTAAVTVPNGVTQLDYQLTTIDCGNSISITPITRPYQTTQFQTRVPPSTGLQGDVNGTTCVGTKVSEVTVTATSNSNATINSSVVVMPGSSISGSILTVGTTDDAIMTDCYISGTTLYVDNLTGNIQVGMELTGTGVAVGTVIQENISGAGAGSYWKVSISQSVPSPTNITGSTPIRSGMLLSGVGVSANTVIVSNDSGTGAGSTWNINIPQNVTSTTITGSTGIVGNILYVGQLASGSIAEGTILTGSVINNTTIVSKISGTGSGSVWTVSQEQYTTPSVMTGVRDAITCNNTAGFYLDMPIVFTGNTFGGIVPGTTYYVKDIMNATDFSVTLTPGGDGETTIVSSDTGTMYGNPVNYLYVCTQDYDGQTIGPKSVLNTYAYTNYIRLDNVVNLNVNSPIIFEGQTFGGLVANVPYYIKSIDSGNSNITISQTKYNGIAGATHEVISANTSGVNACAAYSIVGSDIWKQIPLLPDTDAGSNITAANAYLENNLFVNGDATVNGNLVVNGTVTYGTISYVDIDASGNANLENIFANNITTNTLTTNGIATFPNVANLRIEGGFNGYYLQTDGQGNLNWAAAGSGSGNGSPGGGTNQVQFNDGTGNFAGSPNFEFNSGINVLSVTGNINSNNITATGNVTTGNLNINEVVTFDQVANLQFNDSSGNNGKYLQLSGSSLSWSSGTGSGTTTAAGGANTQIQYNNAGAIDGSAGLTFDNTSNQLAVAGNVTAANVYANSGTVVATSITGSLTTAAQPNITSIGTLSSLNVSGNVKAGALYANTAVTIDPTVVQGFAAGSINETGTGFTGAGIVVGSSSGQHGAITYGGNAMTFATENNNSSSMSAKAFLYSNGLFQTDFLTGTLSNAASNQPNIRSLGTLNTLTVSGNVSANNFVGRLSNGSSNVSIPVGSGSVVISATGNANVFSVNGSGANVNGSLGATGNISTVGANRGFVGGYITARGNVTGNLEVSGNVTGSLGIRANTQTYTDNAALSSQSLGLAAAHAIDISTYAAANTGVVLANAATFAIKGAPIAGTNISITNAYALYADETSYIANLESNNISAGNISVAGIASFVDENSIKIPGGQMGYFLQTDGNGDLTWANGTVTPTGSGTSAGANQSVQFSDGLGTFQANAGFTFNSTTGNLSVPGNISVTGINGVITVASGYQPNITTVGTLTGVNTIGNITTAGTFKGIFGSFVTTGGIGAGSINSSSFTSNIGLKATPSIFNESFAGIGNIIANAAVHGIGAPEFTATNTGVVLSNAVSFLVKGEPTAGTNITITNKYALWVDGNSRFSNNLTVAGNLTVGANLSIANVESLKIGSNGSVTNYYLQSDGAGGCKWSIGTVSAISVPGGSNTQIQFNDSTTMAGSANLTFDKGTNNLTIGNGSNIGNLITTGKVYSGVVAYANTDGTAGQILTTDGAGTTYWATPATVSIVQNGTSNVSIPTGSGNVNTSVNGTANVLVVTQTGANILGNVNVTANVIVGSNLFAPTVNSYLIKDTANIKFNIGATNKVTIDTNGLRTPNTINVGGIYYTNTSPSSNGQVLTGNTDGTTTWTTVSGSGTQIVNGASNVRIATSGGNIEINPASGKSANVSGDLNATSVYAVNQMSAAAMLAYTSIAANAYTMLSGAIVTETGTTKTLSQSDDGKVLYFTSATAVTLTTQSGLSPCYSVVCIQGGAGKITVAQGVGTTRVSYGDAYNSAGQYAVISIMCPVANTFVISGQTSST